MSEEIEAMFASLSVFDTSSLAGDDTVFSVIHRGGSESGERSVLPADEKKRRHSEHNKAWNRRDDVKQKQAVKNKMARLRKRIEQWRASAQCIAIGRDLDPKQWLVVMTEQDSPDARAAQDDFMHYLRVCQSVRVYSIAQLMNLSQAEVTARLATRGVK